MKPAEFRLLIHYHDVAFVDGDGEIWLSSGIARWVAILADRFLSIGLLLHESDERSEKQDTPIGKPNVVLHSLGPPGNYWNRIPRIRRIRQVCKSASNIADGILIRGYTPRQHTVWRHTGTRYKAFLLICSLDQKRPIRPTPAGIIVPSVYWNRRREFRKIANSETTLLANSTQHLSEIEATTDRAAHFSPTNTISASDFVPFKARVLFSPIRLLYVGRLCFRKGLRELLSTLSRLRASGHDCVLDVVAHRVEPVYSQLLELAIKLGVEEYVRWHNFVPYGPDLFEFFRGADVFVLPTYNEGVPRVLWEAAANCTPIAATAVGGIPEVFEHERHALLFRPKNIESAEKAITRLILDDGLRKSLVKSAYELAQQFSAESCGQGLTDILASEWE